MNIGVVLTTFNRLDKLKIALNCYDEQTYAPSLVIVVDNHSNDGTYEYLEEWKTKKSVFNKIVLHLNENTGGSGGFYNGLKESLSHDVDWVWVSDDDAFPEKDCFEIINKFYKKHKNEDISALCGTIMNRGNIDVMHRRRLKTSLLMPYQFFVNKKEYNKDCFEINLFTYVGTFINKDKLFEAGLTKKDYFIYCDDSEHSIRLSKIGKIYCVPKAKIIHDGPLNNGKDGVNWKLYYGIRNSIDFIRCNYPKQYVFNYRIYFRLKYYLMTLLLWSHKVEGLKLINAALRAAKNKQQGLDSIYKPGWRVNDEK